MPTVDAGDPFHDQAGVVAWKAFEDRLPRAQFALQVPLARARRAVHPA